jgi:glutaredoxin
MFLVVKKEFDYFNFLYYLYSVMYIIVKMIKQMTTNVELPVVLLDGQDDVMEFETQEEAEKMRSLFEKNSDSGHKYIIKQI